MCWLCAVAPTLGHDGLVDGRLDGRDTGGDRPALLPAAVRDIRFQRRHEPSAQHLDGAPAQPSQTQRTERGQRPAGRVKQPAHEAGLPPSVVVARAALEQQAEQNARHAARSGELLAPQQNFVVGDPFGRRLGGESIEYDDRIKRVPDWDCRCDRGQSRAASRDGSGTHRPGGLNLLSHQGTARCGASQIRHVAHDRFQSSRRSQLSLGSDIQISIGGRARSQHANSRAFAEIEQLRERLRLENDYLREEVKQERLFGDIVGESPALHKVLDQITLVAQSEVNVLVLGESGTGKELIARAIHERSQRANGPLVKVNCASIPHDLFESEFFGHIRGAFTGAIRDRVGRFQLADGGTLFLDEVGEIPLDLQSKLLRVLQEGTFERVGEEKTRRTNIRLVAATNRDLRREIQSGAFRQDLFFRLSVFPIELPPLRERLEDIPLLVRHFIQQAAQRARCGNLKIGDEQMQRLQNYTWPGNVRELQNVIERAMILSSCGTKALNLNLILPDGEAGTSTQSFAPPQASTITFVTQAEWEKQERQNLMAALEAANWKIYGAGGAAELLGVKATTLASRLQAMGIKKVRE